MMRSCFDWAWLRGFSKRPNRTSTWSAGDSCVDNSQLTVENAGKAILAFFGISPKTHDPERHLAKLIKSNLSPQHVMDDIKSLLPDLLTLGKEEHFSTDYGDELGGILPWDLYTKESAISALASAGKCATLSRRILQNLENPKREENEEDGDSSNRHRASNDE